MRTFLIALLLAGAAASPALAQDQNDNGHHHDQRNNGHEQQQRAPQQQGAQQQQRGYGEAYGRQQAPQYVRPQALQYVRQQPVEGEQGRRGFDQQRFQGRGYAAPQGDSPQQVYRGYRGGPEGQVQPQQVQNLNGQRGTWNNQRGTANGEREWNRQREWNSQREVVQQQVRPNNRWAGSNWNRDWRSDRRYDWRRYRDEHRTIFRLGFYSDPFGYGYQSFNIGFRLMPAYYGQRFWIDPGMYELPYPPPGTEWVRYWNDAILVDLYSGQVVDVIHNFFW